MCKISAISVDHRARLGIIGPNGEGKSTLLNMIAGRLEPDSGEIEIGATVKIGYYDQESVTLDESQRIIDYITNIAEVIHTAKGDKNYSGANAHAIYVLEFNAV